MDNLVSILVPVYNREHFIAETLHSALSQTYKNIELIVVDNASQDDTWRVILDFAAKDSRVKAFRNETNIGPVKNWKRCIEKASGFYGKILWSDDLISPNYLAKCLPLFDEETAFVYSGVKIFTDSPEDGDACYFIGNTGLRKSSEYITRALIDNNVPVSPGCAVFRLDDLKKNLLVDIENRVNSDFSMHAIGNDLLLFLLTAKDYKKFGFVAEALSFFRAHPGSITISSVDGKLPLHYMLVRAYFAERFKNDMIDQVAANAWFLLKKYPSHSSFGINDLSDFFCDDVKINYNFFALSLIKRLVWMPVRVARKIFRMLEGKK
ncbi:glycosyltransferase family 2 protein [Mangrovitalea sediminis]|uniref:glycosyltransferase family 2 protein n=1 Tax=Mangrovitalea sediminis TaxID=1982043 RepID=UPI000BE5C9AD|nr:glycosyltransferase family 2 protein [Mangrovitalea sediminis]